MEDTGSGFNPNSAFVSLPNNTMDVDFMDELLLDGCWLGTAPSQHFSSEPNGNRINRNLSQQAYQEQTPKSFLQNLPPVAPNSGELAETRSQQWKVVKASKPTSQAESFSLEGAEAGRGLWIGPRICPGPSFAVQDRLMRAIRYLKSWMRDRDFLIQIWVPVKEGGRQFLTTKDQPYSLDLNCKSLISYRGVSSTYQFPADQGCKEFIGLPGRVFLEKLPEWTPDVRFFRKEEYPRIDYAQQYDVRGSIALPVFERGSGTCLAVVEFVTTMQKPNYRPELENVYKALEAVDLVSSHNVNPPNIKASSEKYQTVLPGIVEVLTSVSKMYQLPLAQTWGLCAQQGKDGCRHSNENYTFCVSTVDSACFVADSEMLDFHEACSEHHLFQGQGLVGRAFLTNKPVFASDVTAFPKTRYPLSHHARMYGLHAAAAIPLRSIHAGSADLVLEFFLPKDCQGIEQQKQMLNSLFILIKQSCQTLHVLIGREFESEVAMPDWDIVAASDEAFCREETQKSVEKPSWIAHLIEAQHKGKGISISVESQKEPNEEFKLTAHWDEDQRDSHHGALFSEHGQYLQDSVTNASIDVYQDSSGRCSSGSRNSGEKRRTKIEKTISLEVLRKYFAGSLKDAAKSIGVCPTTLKRICRQHGITRWPSRKIKKVGHSLRKLQLVIDSVQGADGAIQIGSFYKSFPELNSPNISGTGPFSFQNMNMNDHSNRSSPEAEDGPEGQDLTSSKSRSLSGSQSSGSSTCSSTGGKQQESTENILINSEKDNGGLLNNGEMKVLNQEGSNILQGNLGHKLISDPLPNLGNLSSLPEQNDQNSRDARGFRVKATFGDEKVRLTLQSTWKFSDLQQEISRRFNIDDANKIDLKYLDDENEWVLLTCDADLDECIDIYKSSQSRTIKLSLFQPSRSCVRGSFGAKT